MTKIHFHDLYPPLVDIKKEIIDGLSKENKTISPKFFYDSVGSKLFDEITESPEYYPTRTEIGILKKYGKEMLSIIGNNSLLIEWGSGSSQKIRLLLDILEPEIYMPIDISKQHLQKSVQSLAKDHPKLNIHAVCADYSNGFLRLPPISEKFHKVAFFPGSSIGNFEPEQAKHLLTRIASLLGRDGILLIGVDLKKDIKILNSAYNDKKGTTATFNLNLLKRLNRELKTNFDISSFNHKAFYNEKEGRIEMHLVSNISQEVMLDNYKFSFQKGETIHTENSYKFTIEEFQTLVSKAGFHAEKVWTDSSNFFSVHCLRV
ncbi:MAG: L-histidine N(alpha)-methyltransferase [Leptospiraceae bacterium]|nr:L-histidine N(alpha)-methyltransferase [Leptospiraceae bacterium]MCP5496007.1 L-histidine N(alpha)-methyltransferase [Leptospiraceae bacterium]